jgi:predicted hotdog family 3-hydroxylacyl-ACP dehydratase
MVLAIIYNSQVLLSTERLSWWKCPALRNATGLPISAGIEYAAQAMAVHGALGAKDSGRPRSGYLAVLSRVEWFRETLDDLPGELAVVAHRLASSESGSNYRFQVFHEGQSLLEGQAVVALRD